MKKLNPYLDSHPVKLLVLCVLYIATGKLGLLLAVPPGYATVIWPPSGIALGILIMHSARLWPGIFLGSFILNCTISDTYTPEGFNEGHILAAFSIAAGSTLQALIGRALVAKFVGIPLKLSEFKEMAALFILSGPVACLVAASIGTASLYYFGMLTANQFSENWLAWWLGDIFGIFVFLPIALVAPGSKNRLTWRGNQLGALPVVAMLAILMPMGLTFYAWKIASEGAYEKSRLQFESLALEGEKALIHRLSSYQNALLGAEGFIQGSDNVSRAEWKSYIEAIDVSSNFPGINGIGWAEDIKPDAMQAFIKKMHKDGAPGFAVHPETNDALNYIVAYMEPELPNRQAVGLNIAFEKNRLEAAMLSRDSGKPVITKRIALVQDDQKTAGFLLLHPVYKQRKPINTPDERKAAFLGWIVAPFIAGNFMKDLVQNQRHLLNLRIYDGDTISEDALIYKSGTNSANPSFTKSKAIEVMQQKWLLVWESMPAYERMEKNYNSLFILVTGLLFTGMLGIFLLVTAAKRTETIEWLSGENHHALPLIVFAALTAGSFLLYRTLEDKELRYVKTLAAQEANKIELLLTTQTHDRLSALKRMAQRWETANGTAEHVWRSDARNLAEQLSGLKTVEWVDSAYRIRWVEPLKGNERVTGMDVRFDETRANALEGAAEKDSTTLTPPLELTQGYKAFIAYVPVRAHGKFDGFIAGVFPINDFFGGIAIKEMGDDYEFSMRYSGQVYFQNDAVSTLHHPDWGIEKPIRIYDKLWQLRLTPTESFINSQRTWLPVIVLIAGIMISALSALIVRFVLLSKLKSSYLENYSKRVQSSEERYDLAMRGMSVGVWDWQIESDSLYWSEKFLEILGIADATYKPSIEKFAALLYPDDVEFVFDMLSGHLLQQNPYNVKYRLQHSSGKYIWVHASGQAQWDETGKAIRMVGSVIDINDRVEAVKALEQSNSLKTAVLSSAQHMVVATTPNGVVTVFNKAAEKALGYTANETIGRQTPALWHDAEEIDRRAATLSERLGIHVSPGFDVFRKIADVNYPSDTEWTFITKSGKRFPANVVVTTLKNDEQETTGYVAIIEDITERKKAEQALKTSEETFRSAIEDASIGMALVEPSGRWLKVNQALCEMLGYEKLELLQNDFQSITHPDDLEADLAYIRKMLADEIKTYKLEKRYYHKSGRIIWAQLSVSLVRQVNGEPNYFIAQIQDITEQKEIERIKSEFISIVSHELRTPLTSIRGSLGLILGALSKDLPEKVKGLIGIAHNNCERLILLINDILDIDKMAAGQMRFDMRDERLADITEQAVHATEAYAQKFDVHVKMEAIDENVKIHVDADRYVQVLSNLLSNAAKFSPKGSNIRLFVRLKSSHARICVMDNGPGIPEEFRGRIFGKFSQADSSATRTKGGTGLGLHIAKQMVEHMGGHIGFDTETGKGTTFWVEFPIAREATSEQPIQCIYTPASNLPSILHVEDDADLSNMLATALHDKANVLTAITLHQAEQYLMHNTFDMIVLDVGLPDGSGLHLLERLESLCKKPLPVVVLSADLPPDDIHGQVAAVMVKSRMSETKIVETIVTILEQGSNKNAA